MPSTSTATPHRAEPADLPRPSGCAHLLPALRWLDARLAEAVAAAEAAYGAGAAGDAYRGLYVDLEQVGRLLTREPGAPLLAGAGPTPVPAAPGDGTPLGRLAALHGLEPFDLGALLVALAPELDLRYERLYAYLQDDVTRRRPSVSLILDLLAPDAAARLTLRSRLGPRGPLARGGVVELVHDPSQLRPPLLAQALRVDDLVLAFLLGESGPDPRLAAFCTLDAAPSAPADTALDPALRGALSVLGNGARRPGEPLRVYLSGADPASAAPVAAAAGVAARSPVLSVALERAPLADAELAPLLRLAFREARLRGAVLSLSGTDRVREEGHPATRAALLAALGEHDGIVLLSGERRWEGGGAPEVHEVDLGVPPFERRRACWTRALDGAEAAISGGELDALADRFRLLPGQVERAVADARLRARWRAAAATAAGERPSTAPEAAELFAAARAASGETLGRLATRVEAVYEWDDLVLPADALAQLRELWQRVAHRRTVMGRWGFERKLAHGRGVTALFSGPSGTGKTMAAQVLAGTLGLDLYRIDLSTVVSKYIGETEKHLARVFADAESANAILFFDEADAIFGKRSEVRDSHDRYANLEVGYLLQRIEDHEGVVLLATNLRKNMDEAFARRLAFSVSFPFPDEAERLRIWSRAWPRETPLAPDLDLPFLASRFRLSGGNIRNVALAAAFLAADEDAEVGMPHVARAVRREYQKLGKVCVEADFGPYYPLVTER